MDELPPETPVPEPGNLRFLRRLVTTLTAVMILGMLSVVTLLVLRFNQSAPAPLLLPEEIVLPDGSVPTAFTAGAGWYAVVTDGDTVLIYDATTGALRQTIPIVLD